MKNRTVGLGSYNFDSHFVSRIIRRTGEPGNDYVVKEGRVKVQQEMPNDRENKIVGNDGSSSSSSSGSCGVCMDVPWRMPYDAMLPKQKEVTNLLVPVSISASHVRYNAVRMEPAWMILGHAAGAAAALILEYGLKNVHSVDVGELQRLLVEQKQLLVWNSE